MKPIIPRDEEERDFLLAMRDLRDGKAIVYDEENGTIDKIIPDEDEDTRLLFLLPPYKIRPLRDCEK